MIYYYFLFDSFSMVFYFYFIFCIIIIFIQIMMKVMSKRSFSYKSCNEKKVEQLILKLTDFFNSAPCWAAAASHPVKSTLKCLHCCCCCTFIDFLVLQTGDSYNSRTHTHKHTHTHIKRTDTHTPASQQLHRDFTIVNAPLRRIH